MKHILYITTIILSLAYTSCRSREANHAVRQVIDSSEICSNNLIDSADQLINISPAPLVKRTTISYATTNSKYATFGEIGYDVHSFKEDTLNFPPIRGLVHRNCYAYCPKDGCYHDYSVLALRCTHNEVLLEWLSNQVRQYVIGLTMIDDTLLPTKKFISAKEICYYYMDWLDNKMKSKECEEDSEAMQLNYEDGLLLADCWENDNLCTFYEIRWCNQNNLGHEAYRTVDANTGKELNLFDFVDSAKLEDFLPMMMTRLVNENGEYYIEKYNINEIECSSKKAEVFLKKSSGSALIEEGLIVYYYPYNLGSGGDGEFEAIIPYKELEGILNESVWKRLN